MAGQWPIYVISMDDERYDRTLSELASIGISGDWVARVEGVDGATARQGGNITRGCKLFCTNRVVGCAQAHKNTSRKFIEASGHSWALVLEDDIKVLKNTTLEAIQAAGEYAIEKDLDFLLLFCQGACDNQSRMKGSTAAYIMTRKGARADQSKPVSGHIDCVRNAANVELEVNREMLFSTHDARSGISLGGQSASFWLQQDIVRVAGVDLKLWHVIVAEVIILISIATWVYKSHHLTIAPQVILALAVSLPVSLLLYTMHDDMHYEASATATVSYTVTAVLIIAYLIWTYDTMYKSNVNHAWVVTIASTTILTMACYQLEFQVLYLLNRPPA
jgi:hypothetical protein